MDVLTVASRDFLPTDSKTVATTNKVRRKVLNYPVEEFLQHMRALPTVRQYEHISKGFSCSGEQVEIGNDNSDVGLNALRILDYFHQVYADKEEAQEKGCLFFVMLMHLVKHQDEYDSESFAVFTATDQPSMISVPLLKALHYHYTSWYINAVPPEKDLVKAIKQTARQIIADEDKPELPA
jgi:hypothetical protein